MAKVDVSQAAPIARLVRPWQQLPPNLQGIAWTLLAGIMLTMMAALVKQVSLRIPVLEIVFVRQLVMTAILSPRIIRNPVRAFATDRLGLHMLRAFFALISLTAGFTALAHLPLADATAISFSRSFFVAIFAILLLGEVVGRARWGAIVFGFVGILLMAGPLSGALDIYALLGLLSAATVGLVMVIIRKLAQSEPLATVMTYQAVSLMICLAIPAWLVWVPPTPEEWLLLISIGLCSTIGQSFTFRGFRVGEATALAPADYMRLIYAAVIGFLMFAELPRPATFAGAGLIIASSLYAIYSERRRRG